MNQMLTVLASQNHQVALGLGMLGINNQDGEERLLSGLRDSASRSSALLTIKSSQTRSTIRVQSG
jgi:hypothetical protein